MCVCRKTNINDHRQIISYIYIWYDAQNKISIFTFDIYDHDSITILFSYAVQVKYRHGIKKFVKE